MGKIIFALPLMILTLSPFCKAEQTSTLVECKLDQKYEEKSYTIKFLVKNIEDSKSMDLEYLDKKSEESGIVVQVSPENSIIEALNENYTASVGEKGLHIGGDSDGVFLTELLIYKNSGFKKGYFKVYGGESNEIADFYTTVSCSITSQ